MNEIMEFLGFEPFCTGPGVHVWLSKRKKGDIVVDALDETLDGMDLSRGARIGYYLHTGNGWGDPPAFYKECETPELATLEILKCLIATKPKVPVLQAVKTKKHLFYHKDVYED